MALYEFSRSLDNFPKSSNRRSLEDGRSLPSPSLSQPKFPRSRFRAENPQATRSSTTQRHGGAEVAIFMAYSVQAYEIREIVRFAIDREIVNASESPACIMPAVHYDSPPA